MKEYGPIRVCDPFEDGNEIRQRDIDTFTFSVKNFRYGNGHGQRLYISGLDEFTLHYDVITTIDIILALIDFARPHTWQELDYDFVYNALNEEKIKNFERPFSYPTEMVSEEGLIALFDLVADKSAYDFLKTESNFDYHRDFFTQVSRYYVDTVEELNEFTEYARRVDPIYNEMAAAELRPKSRWLSIYDNRKSVLKRNKSKIKPQNRNDKTPGYNAWRNQVISRDQVCQCCGHDDKLEAHHLFGYKENQDLATNINNGVTLCKFCHKKYHSIYGLKNINPIDFMKFIKRFGGNGS